MNTTDCILSNKFLFTGASADNSFSGTDSESCFEKNLKTQPEDWYYRCNPVNYTFNSEGYRTFEFDTIDWANAVVIIGGSDVVGVGLDSPHTISSQLEKLINRPVINLGISSSSIQCATYNATILASGYPCPYAVIQLWSIPERTMLFAETQVAHIGCWTRGKINAHLESFFKQWIAGTNPQASALMHRKISEQLWANRSQHLEATLFKDTAVLFNCRFFKYYDYARDQIHPGIKTTAHIAAYFAEQLK